MNHKQSDQLLKPSELLHIKDLFLVARNVVEGMIAGHHKSPFKGFSLEFAEHRKYVPGDELKHIDWKVYGRTGKYFVKQYEAETNMKVYIVMDVSASMAYGQDISKCHYAKVLAAALTYIVNKQDDQVSLTTYNETIINSIPPRSGSIHMKKIIESLKDISPSGETKTSAVLKKIIQKIKRRGLVILISDLFDDYEEMIDSISILKHRKNEFILFHVLHNDELVFPYREMMMFKDSESFDKITVDPIALREEYLKAIKEYQTKLKKGLLKMGCDYIPVNTMIPYEYALSSYLMMRQNKAL